MTTASLWNVDVWRLIYGHLPDKELVRSRLVRKEFDEVLCLLVKQIFIEMPLAQLSLGSLKNTYPNLEELDIDLECVEDENILLLKDAHLPSLQHLHLTCCPLRSVVFTEARHFLSV